MEAGTGGGQDEPTHSGARGVRGCWSVSAVHGSGPAQERCMDPRGTTFPAWGRKRALSASVGIHTTSWASGDGQRA